jgi:hypothetical protein
VTVLAAEWSPSVIFQKWDHGQPAGRHAETLPGEQLVYFEVRKEFIRRCPMNFSFYHQIPLWLDCAIFLAVLLTALELGYRIGLKRKEA